MRKKGKATPFLIRMVIKAWSQRFLSDYGKSKIFFFENPYLMRILLYIMCRKVFFLALTLTMQLFYRREGKRGKEERGKEEIILDTHKIFYYMTPNTGLKSLFLSGFIWGEVTIPLQILYPFPFALSPFPFFMNLLGKRANFPKKYQFFVKAKVIETYSLSGLGDIWEPIKKISIAITFCVSYDTIYRERKFLLIPGVLQPSYVYRFKSNGDRPEQIKHLPNYYRRAI
ncbi:hypothetical protein H6G81_26435 [Scytonema hofmannii FACHB-248]|uniref:Uncharacterized protein n=1 Tax=Scytonema hofmannii FACHB-248 TaxID=1842502 RepID=A0ABR8GXT1_9CYAN|nr:MULTISPECIES: hypothetical protein [Nostocales]MBD2607958.1 hypothetical protein [Scytonema hofmannii FACHB-248]